MMKLSAASALIAATATAAVIGLGAPAFATTGSVAHRGQAVCGSCGASEEAMISHHGVSPSIRHALAQLRRLAAARRQAQLRRLIAARRFAELRGNAEARAHAQNEPFLGSGEGYTLGTLLDAVTDPLFSFLG